MRGSGGRLLVALLLLAGSCGPAEGPPESPTPESERRLEEAAALASGGRPAEALRVVESVLAAQPRLVAANARAADLARRTGDAEAAARYARRALSPPPTDPADLAAVARAIAPSEPDRAEALLRSLPADASARADAELAAADAALARGDRSAALPHLRRALDADPTPGERLDVARGFSRAGFHSDAVATAGAAIAAGDSTAEARYTLGWTLEQAERYDECAKEYSALLADHPDYLPAYRNLGALMARDGELPRAVELWERGLRYHPEDEGLRANIDQALDALGLARKEGSE